MTTVDRTAASDATFAAELARIEAAPEAEEALRERVAAAIWESHRGAVPWAHLSPKTPTRTEYRRLADAALAAIRTPTTEEHNHG